ncbi:MAG: SDR family NAD(P)-dependent oxidoreductase, partial [Candidatus Njordarchaeales archaeon]
MKLKSKIAIVTGGASGLGKAAAIALAKEGANIVIADIDISSAEIVVEEIKKLKRKAFCIQVDITNSKEVEEMVKKAVRTFERIDILVNSAGIARGPNQ